MKEFYDKANNFLKGFRTQIILFSGIIIALVEETRDFFIELIDKIGPQLTDLEGGTTLIASLVGAKALTTETWPRIKTLWNKLFQ